MALIAALAPIGPARGAALPPDSFATTAISLGSFTGRDGSTGNGFDRVDISLPEPYFAVASSGIDAGIDPVTSEILGAAGSEGFAASGIGYGKARTAAGFSYAMGDWYDAQGQAQWVAQAVASASGTATFGALFDRALLADPLGFAERRDAVLAAAVAASYDTSRFRAEIFQIESQARLTLQVRDLDAGNGFQLDVIDRLRRQLYIGFNTAFDEPYFIWGADDDVATTSVYTGSTDGSDANAQYIRTLSDLTLPLLSGRGFALSEQHELMVPLIAGNRYRFELTVSCGSYVGVGAPLPGLADQWSLAALCDAGRSGYFAGLLRSDDGNGNPIAGLSLLSGSGTDLTLPSPSFPTAPIPEPTSWAMLVAGFGLIGAVRRRRLHLVAA